MCNNCNHEEKLTKKFKKTLADFPLLVTQIHPTLNGDIDPSKIGFGSRIKIWWICNECGHMWLTALNKRFGKNNGVQTIKGCKKCSHKKKITFLTDIEKNNT